jgi:tetratricopeptide (TPR) repeat protein
MSGYAGTSSGADLVRQLIAAVGFYSVKFVWPMPQSAYIPEVPQNGLTLGIGALAVAGVVIAAVRTWRRGSRVTAWLLAWCAATLAPSLMVIVRVSAQAPVAERYLYPPSVGACLLVGWLATRSVRARGPLMIGVGALCLWFAVASMVRNRVWSDALLFWQDVAAKAPDHALGHRELAQIYLNRNQIPEAEAAISRALQAKSDRDGRVMTLNNAGTIYLRQQRLDDAERVFSEGLALYPHGYLYYGLGRIAVSRAELAQRRGDSQETRRQVLLARDYLLQAVQAEPDGAKAHALLGQVFFNLRDLPAARRHLQQALDLGATGSVAAGARTYLKMAGDGIEADAPGR